MITRNWYTISDKKQANEMSLEESETDDIIQTENPTKLNMRNI